MSSSDRIPVDIGVVKSEHNQTDPYEFQEETGQQDSQSSKFLLKIDISY